MQVTNDKAPKPKISMESSCRSFYRPVWNSSQSIPTGGNISPAFRVPFLPIFLSPRLSLSAGQRKAYPGEAEASWVINAVSKSPTMGNTHDFPILETASLAVFLLYKTLFSSHQKAHYGWKLNDRNQHIGISRRNGTGSHQVRSKS